MTRYRSTCIALVTALSFVGATARTSNDGWLKFKGIDRTFSAEAPGLMESSTSVDRSSELGVVTAMTYKLMNEKRLLYIRDVKFAPEVVASKPHSDEKVAKAIAMSMHSTSLSLSKKKFQGYNATYMTIQSGQYQTKGFLFWTKDHSYIVYASDRLGDANSYECKRFLNSFRLTSK